MAAGEQAYQILVDNQASEENIARTRSTRGIMSRWKSRTGNIPSPSSNDIYRNVLLPFRRDPL
ncbi:MAG: hypothetical protein V8R55_05640 [Dysosmobacter sp.]